MRRALLVAVLATPAVAFAQVLTDPGELVEINNFNAANGASYINAAQCAGTEQLNLEWTILPNVIGTPVSGGTYGLFASDKEPVDADGGLCAEEDQPNATPTPVNAGPLETVVVNSAVQREQVSGADAAREATPATVTDPCASSREGKVVFICAHWKDANSNPSGRARGKFIIQIAKPTAPTGVNVEPGEGRLIVTWTASTGGAVLADRYFARATPVGGGSSIDSGTTNGTRATITGLANGTPYDVVVFALSVGGNPSDASAAAEGTPIETDDFWEFYRNQPGAHEEGGCGVGGEGPLALLGISALLAALRRRK